MPTNRWDDHGQSTHSNFKSLYLLNWNQNLSMPGI